MSDQMLDAYKNALIDISHLVTDDDLQRMKFKCDQRIKKKEREKIVQPIHLFSALEERALLSHTDTHFLKELLTTCCAGKRDGLHILEQYEQRQFLGSGAPPFQRGTAQYFTGDSDGGQARIVYIAKNDVLAPPMPAPMKPRYEGPDLTREISFLCRKVGRDWKFCMRALGVREDDIENISCDYKTVRERIHQCFLLWQHDQQQNACKQKLIDALRHHSVQRNDLASKLEEGAYE